MGKPFNWAQRKGISQGKRLVEAGPELCGGLSKTWLDKCPAREKSWRLTSHTTICSFLANNISLKKDKKT